MNLIKPSFIIITEINYENVLDLIQGAGRVCYKSKTDPFPEKFVKKIIDSGHESVIEHYSITVKITCDRGVSHEIVRHRIASYSQESTRYCNYSGGVTFVIPPWTNVDPGEYNHPSDFKDEILNHEDWYWIEAMLNSEKLYLILLNHKWTPQQARSVLPNSLKTEIVMTCNIREWRHFFKLRTPMAAHPQMREIAIPMLGRFVELMPVFFEDINPK